MADYWKSLPRKFCDICKCWFADNKASIDFHEKGKRHQENVKKRISELQKKGLKEYEAQKNLENEMKKIEEAALLAYKKDLENDPELAEKVKESVAKNENGTQEPLRKSEELEKEIGSLATEEKSSEKEWYEAMSEEGYVYYWNVNTAASQWEPPEEGYVSLEEQQQHQTEDESTTEHIGGNSKGKKGEESEKHADDETPADAIGPQPKPDPYGQWVTVERPTEDPVDLQLPEKSDNIVEMYIPVTNDDSRIKIKEKIIGHLDDSFSSENSVFKKRKNIGDVKRNVRQRLKDDD